MTDSPDYVMVPNSAWEIGKLMCNALFGRWELISEQDKYIAAGERMLPVLIAAAPPSPRSSGLTPSEHGSSAALRAQVIEECIGVIEARLAQARSVSDDLIREIETQDKPSTSGQRSVAICLDARAAEALIIIDELRSLSAVSAIAQERDVGKFAGHTPTPWALDTREFAAWGSIVGPDDLLVASTCVGARYSVEELKAARQAKTTPPTVAANAALIVAAVNAFTTSPKAISEAPTSADAVKTSPEVGEMVERLKKYRPKNEWGDGEQHTICDEAAVVITALAAENARLRSSPSDDVGELVDLLQKHGNINNDGDYDDLALMRDAASLLIALDAERGRLREALKGFVDAIQPDGPDQRSISVDSNKLKDCLRRARSALPASDEG